MKKNISLEEGLALIKKQKKFVLLILLIIGVMCSGWIFSPKNKEENNQKEKEYLSNRKKVDFNVELDTINNASTSIFSRKKEQKEIMSNNPFVKKKEDEDLKEKVDALEKLGTKEEFNPYTNRNMWKMEKSNDPNLGLSKHNKQESLEDTTKDLEEDEIDDSPIVYYSSPETKKKKKANYSKLYEAKILGKQTISSKNPRAIIRVLEDMQIDDLFIPRNTNMEAVASFDESRVYLTVKYININNMSRETNILITNREGYPGIAVAGGTGAQIEGETSSEISNDISNTQTANEIPGSRSLVSAIFSKTAKAKLNGDYIKLKIVEE